MLEQNLINQIDQPLLLICLFMIQTDNLLARIPLCGMFGLGSLRYKELTDGYFDAFTR